MNGNVIPFVSKEKYFLKNTICLFKALQEETRSEEKQATLDEVAELLRKFEKSLPDYWSDILWLMKEVVSGLNPPDIEEIHVEEVLLLAELFEQEPSVKVFQEMVRFCYTSLPIYPYFTEELLNKVMVYLIERQECLKTEMQENQDEDNFYAFQAPQQVLYSNWIALVRMKNASESLLIKAIESAELNLYNLYSFCEEVILSENATEKVLLTLVKRIQEFSWKEGKKDYRNLFPIRLYCFLLAEGKATEKIARQMLEAVEPRGPLYYQFYYSIVQNFKKSPEVMKHLSTILERDETTLGGRNRSSRKKLLFLLQNRNGTGEKA